MESSPKKSCPPLLLCRNQSYFAVLLQGKSFFSSIQSICFSVLQELSSLKSSLFCQICQTWPIKSKHARERWIQVQSLGLNKPHLSNWEKDQQPPKLVSRTEGRKFSIVLSELQRLRSAYFIFLISSSSLIFTVYLTKCITDFDVEFTPVLQP